MADARSLGELRFASLSVRLVEGAPASLELAGNERIISAEWVARHGERGDQFRVVVETTDGKETMAEREEIVLEARNLIEAGLGIGPLADPKKWNPRARQWLARTESVTE